MEIDEECNQIYMYILEKDFVLLPQLKLYVCTPRGFIQSYTGDQPLCFATLENIGRIFKFTLGI